MSFYGDFPSFKFRDRRANPDNFVDDLRKELETDPNMFDGNFNDFFGPARHSEMRSRMGSQNPGFFRGFDASPSTAPGSSSPSYTGERVIPIHVCGEDEDPNKTKSSNTSAQKSPSEPQRKSEDSHSKKPGSPKPVPPQRNLTAELPQVKEISRGQRAHSAPPSTNQVPTTECGGGQSKKPTANTTGRSIPIVVENTHGHGPGRSSSPKPQQQQTPPQKTSHSSGLGSTSTGDKPQGGEQESKPTPPKKPTLVLDPLQKIKGVYDQVTALSERVKEFKGPSNHKDYLYLDEMLTRLLIQLDDVEVEGKDDVRQARRECIKHIQKTISELEANAQAYSASPNSDTSKGADPSAVSGAKTKPDVGTVGASSAEAPVFRSELTMNVADATAESPDATEKVQETIEKMETA